MDNGAYGHCSPVRLTCCCGRFWPSCVGGREARPRWDCEEGVSSYPVQAEERVDLELSLRGGGETCAYLLQNRTGRLMLAHN